MFYICLQYFAKIQKKLNIFPKSIVQNKKKTDLFLDQSFVCICGLDYSIAARYFSASIADLQPEAAAQIAWR